MNKTIYATLDTETVGGIDTPKGFYNVGVVIHDREGNIFATTSLLVMEFYEEIKNDDYAKKNFHLYAERLARGEISAVATEAEALNIVRNLLRFYNVRYICAYNSAFDLTKTICRELADEFEFIDLWLMALQTICHQKHYAQFCRANGYKSKGGKTCATSAESVYAYISGNGEYNEEHTALADALIEMAIFVRCVKTHKHYTKNVHCWDCTERNKAFPKWVV
jgi:hypothetical protein